MVLNSKKNHELARGVSVTNASDWYALCNDDLSNKLISNGSESLITDGSDSGSMYDMFNNHQDNISQFSQNTVKCVNQPNLDTVKCLYKQ